MLASRPDPRTAVRLAQWVALAFAAAAALQAGSAAARVPFDQKAQRFVSMLRTHYPGTGPLCAVDVFLDDRGVVYRTGDDSAAAGFAAGDRVVSVEDQPFAGVDRHRALVQSHPVGASLRYRVARGRETKKIAVECQDVRPEVELWISALAAGARKQWSDCVATNERFIAEGGASAGAHMVSFLCETERTEGRASPSAVRFASETVDALIEESVHQDRGFDRNGHSILELLEWLRANGEQERADALAEKLRAAQTVPASH